MDFPEHTTKDGIPMARIASGVGGSVNEALEAARTALRELGLDLAKLPKEDVIIDVGRRAGGGSFWIVWIKEALLPGGGRIALTT